MEQQIPVCQSCSMPLRREEDHGTNADNTRNNDYCRFCFQNGKFMDEGITMEQKIEQMVGLAAKMNISQDQARKMAQNILPKLKRWSDKI